MEALPVVAVIGVGSLGCYIASEIVSHGVSEEMRRRSFSLARFEQVFTVSICIKVKEFCIRLSQKSVFS